MKNSGKIILASASPRRRELLERAGVPFEVCVSDADESVDPRGHPAELAMANARLKAVAVARKNAGRYVLGADTVVWLAPNLYGKPKDSADARRMLGELRGRYAAQMEKFQMQNALAEVFRVIARANKYIDETAPWVLAKDEAKKPRLARVLYNLLETLRVCGTLLKPFMPESMEKLAAQIGADEAAMSWEAAEKYGVLPAAVSVTKGENLFPRIDMEKELAALEALKAPKEDPIEPFKPNVVFDDFEKCDFRVCRVLKCEAVKKSQKLLRFELDDGSGTTRQILSGIAMHYKPEELVGKTVAAIVNLPPRKMMGLESCGMLLSAMRMVNGKEELHLVMLDDSIPTGSVLC
mgnify:CR=1 FL=1